MKTKFYLSDINSYFNEAYIENGLANISNTIDLFNELIKNNDMPFNEYIDIINKIYDVKITDNDLFRICSIILGGTSNFVILNTDIICDITKRVEMDNSFKYFEEKHNLYLKVAFTDNTVLNFNHKYGISEITKMIEDRKIVLLEFVLEHEDDSYLDIQYEGLSPIGDAIFSDFTNLKYIRKDYISSVMSFLKNYFTPSKLRYDLNNYINDVKTKFDMIENHIDNVCTNYSLKLKNLENITLECRKIRERKISKK